MKARIVLLGGIVVEADGTPQEIADLTDALRRSHQVARPEVDGFAGPSRSVVAEATEGDDEPSPENLNLGDVEAPESPDGVDEPEPEGSEIDQGPGLEPDEEDEEPEEIDLPDRGDTEKSGPPLDLVVREVADQFRLLADPTRLQILALLTDKGHNVGQLCSDLGDQSQPAVSHHLAKMRHSGLIEARRAGKFSFYTLREEGRELTRLVVPMMAAKARASYGPGTDTLEAEPIDFSDITDDWMHEPPPADEDMEIGDPAVSDEAPPAHMLCRRVLLMVQDLHRRGYERLRVAPGLSPSGLHWRCSIVPVDHVRRDHGALAMEEDEITARYTSSQGARFFDWDDAEHDSPVVLAGKFLERFPDLAVQGKGTDPDYVRWYVRMLRALPRSGPSSSGPSSPCGSSPPAHRR
jgi:DNA-binding transcriptional ArsR family regulator